MRRCNIIQCMICNCSSNTNRCRGSKSNYFGWIKVSLESWWIADKSLNSNIEAERTTNIKCKSARRIWSSHSAILISLNSHHRIQRIYIKNFHLLQIGSSASNTNNGIFSHIEGIIWSVKRDGGCQSSVSWCINKFISSPNSLWIKDILSSTQIHKWFCG